MSTLSDCVLLSKTTLSSDTATVTLSSIPSTFKNLVLFFNVRSSAASGPVTLQFRINNVSTASYNDRWFAGTVNADGSTIAPFQVGGDGGSSTSLATLFNSAQNVPFSTWAAGNFSSGYLNLFGYSTSSISKSVSGFFGNSPVSGQVNKLTTFWGQTQGTTESISSLSFFLSSGNIVSGSDFYLFGYTL
jgi:hypothetical protein